MVGKWVKCCYFFYRYYRLFYLQRFHAYKHHWSDVRLPTLLEVTPYSLEQLDPATNKVLASYCYKDFEGICTVSDYPGTLHRKKINTKH